MPNILNTIQRERIFPGLDQHVCCLQIHSELAIHVQTVTFYLLVSLIQ